MAMNDDEWWASSRLFFVFALAFFVFFALCSLRVVWLLLFAFFFCWSLYVSVCRLCLCVRACGVWCLLARVSFSLSVSLPTIRCCCSALLSLCLPLAGGGLVFLYALCRDTKKRSSLIFFVDLFCFT
jgi:hypothetical protein